MIYRTDAAGSVIPSIHFGPVIDEARALQLKIIPVIQNLHANTWNRAMIAAIITDDSRRSHHVQEIVDTVVQNKWDGIDIDYEASNPLIHRPTFSLSDN